jgi:hypothetical protein
MSVLVRIPESGISFSDNMPPHSLFEINTSVAVEILFDIKNITFENIPYYSSFLNDLIKAEIKRHTN